LNCHILNFYCPHPSSSFIITDDDDIRLTALCPLPFDYLGEPVPEKLNQSGFTGARDSEWQWHQLGHMQIYTLPQTDNHARTPPLSFCQAGCPSCRPTNSIKALKAIIFPVSTVVSIPMCNLSLLVSPKADTRFAIHGRWKAKFI